MYRIALTGLLGLACAAPVAADWAGKSELGLVIARGNTDSETANARIEFLYEAQRWHNESIVRGVRASDSGETTASRYVFSNKTDYDFSERSYAWGALRYDRDRFSSFKHQASAAVGFGRHLIENERHSLVGEIGPGFRYSEHRATGESENETMLRGYLKYDWAISETAELVNRLLVETASENTFAENELSLSVAINSRLALKAGLAVRHNTDVDPGRENTDTLTTVNLVYNFTD
ncbi:MAG: DUF481 domain-containing protein [Wenzhouxiangella sp.]